MKKIGTLNSHLSRIIASMGHMDRLVICDSGLPVPRNQEVVDLALTKGIPQFLDTLRVILEELQVEKAIIASEMQKMNPKVYHEVKALLNHAEIEELPHEKFKGLTNAGGNIYFVRTGEATPYANIILVSGVTFD